MTAGQGKQTSDQESHGPVPFWQLDFLWSVALFAIATALLTFLLGRIDIGFGKFGWSGMLFFVAFGLLTINMGYPHPNFGHVSFDRVAQVASILVLGPLHAAWINGLSSLIWPWHRLRKGVPLSTVLTASLHNAGLMALVILACGLLYRELGGLVPLETLDAGSIGRLLLLLLCMQVSNDLGMLLMVYLRHRDPRRFLSLFSSSVEIVSGLIGVLVAIVYVRMESQVLVLLLVVLCLGMLVLKKFALMRDKLERLVEERTEELRLKSIELERQATHDKLTGLFNRRYVDDWLQREIEASQRSDRELTIALADVDHFKQINDRHSHAVGDEVLRRLSRILQSRCRKTDIVARYGGEEFLLCFPDTSLEFAEQICGQIRAAIERNNWSTIADSIDDDFRITISFGLAAVGSESRRTTVLGAADRQLYKAKSGGRNRVES